jgi:hypothetical protein
MKTAFPLLVFAALVSDSAFCQDVTKEKFDRIIAALDKLTERHDKTDERLTRLENYRTSPSNDSSLPGLATKPERLGYVVDYSGTSPTLQTGPDLGGIPWEAAKCSTIDLHAAMIKEQGVVFAIVLVRPNVLRSRPETENLIRFLTPAFGTRPVILMGFSADRVDFAGRPDIVQFLETVDPYTLGFAPYQLVYHVP